MKHQIRQEMLTRRRAMSRLEGQQKSRMIRDRLAAMAEYQAARTLHCYVSSKDNEVDTYRLMRLALSEGKRVVVPITDFDAGTLRHAEIAGLEELRPARLGLMEPQAQGARYVDISDVDVILVPGIAFDPRGHRVGFGGGFYDRVLAAVSAPKIGLAYQFQVVEHVPPDPHDVAVDWIVTEKRLYRP